jgi:DNA-binding GntR family transcriptional regulator
MRTPRATISEQVYYRIKQMIARRELMPGTQMVLRSLAANLGVSRTPVIEAIRRLERDGLVTVLPKWGAKVREWSREEILEAYTIRRGLEGEAARYFIKQATQQDKQRLVQLNDLFDQFAITDPVRCEETDMELHLHIVRATGFRRLYELIENSKIETATLFGLATRLPANTLCYSDSLHCHEPLVQALLGSDAEVATRAIWAHIDTVLSKILALDW